MPRLLLVLLLLAAHPHAQSQSPPRAQAASANAQQAASPRAQPLNVGDIPFDPALDDPNFQLNDSTRVFQYYNSNSWWLDHKNEYRALFLKAASELNAAGKLPATPSAQTQNGWLTIRFIVNANGQTGRFRVFEMDSAYQPFHFDPRLTACLLTATKNASWVPAHYHGRTYDTYQYITFHLEQGRIIDITP